MQANPSFDNLIKLRKLNSTTNDNKYDVDKNYLLSSCDGIDDNCYKVPSPLTKLLFYLILSENSKTKEEKKFHHHYHEDDIYEDDKNNFSQLYY